MIEEVIALEDIVKDPEKYCWKRDITVAAGLSIDDKKCEREFAEVLKRYGADVFYTEEPPAEVAALIRDVFVAFSEVGCRKNGDFYVGGTWCWKRGLPPS